MRPAGCRQAGTTAAVIGPSGSGKSTLLRTLNRLYEPDRDILLDGRSVLEDNPDRLRQRIGMVFQHFNLFPHRSVLDNVTLAPRKLKRLGAEQARELGLAQLERVGLRHKADVRPPTLAGGQQQRVGIARALAMAPGCDVLRRGAPGVGPRTRQGHPGADRRPRQGRHDDGGHHPRNGVPRARHRTRWCSWITGRWSNRVRPSRYSTRPKPIGYGDSFRKFCKHKRRMPAYWQRQTR